MLSLVFAMALAAQVPPQEPYVPPAKRIAPSTPPERDAALTERVVTRLKERLVAADSNHDGRLSREEAEAAKLGFIIRNFDAIDVEHQGSISMAELGKWLGQRRKEADKRP